MTQILRYRYSAGYVSLSDLHDQHEELKAWDYHALEATVKRSRHRGGPNFNWLVMADGEFAISLSEHLRVSRKEQEELDDIDSEVPEEA